MPLQLYDTNASGTLSATDSFYNLIIKNNNTGYDANGNPVVINNSTPLNFNENRTIPYLHNPKEHFVSIMSFELDSASLPVFICEPIIGETNVNNTIYFFTVTDNAGSLKFHTRLQWQPDDLSTPIPTGPVPSDYTSDPYYFCYSYQHFLTLFNTQIAGAWTAGGLSGNPPFLVYDNKTVTLYGDESQMKTDLEGNSVGYKLFFNNELYLLLSGLPCIRPTETVGTYNRNYQLLFVQNPSGLNTVTLYTDITQTTPYTGIKSVCENIPISYWNPVDSIIFTSTYVNVVPEIVAANSPYGLSGGTTVSNAEQYYILFDYMTPSFSTNPYQPHITYTPQAEFRLSDLYGVGDVNQLQVRALWKDKWGILHIFNLESGGSASIKLLFRKKRFYE